MSTKVAFIFIAPKVEPAKHQAQIETPVVDLIVVGVTDYKQAEEVALKLVSEGVVAIELCAAFGNEGTARIAKAVGDKAIVGAVRFDVHPSFNNQSGDKLFQ